MSTHSNPITNVTRKTKISRKTIKDVNTHPFGEEPFRYKSKESLLEMSLLTIKSFLNGTKNNPRTNR